MILTCFAGSVSCNTSTTSFQNFLFGFAMISNVPITIFSHVGQSQCFLVVYRHCGDLSIFSSKLYGEGMYQIQNLSLWCPILPLRHRAPHFPKTNFLDFSSNGGLLALISLIMQHDCFRQKCNYKLETVYTLTQTLDKCDACVVCNGTCVKLSASASGQLGV